ncbi:MAG: helicase-associated domain-containing protein [Isosphaeraceae bacterium]
MAALPTSSSDPAGPPAIPGESGAEPLDPRLAFRSALARYQAAKLGAIVRLRNLESDAVRPSTLAADLTAQLDSASDVAELLARLSFGSCQALGLFALTETSVWPLAGLTHALATLGVEPRSAIFALLELGLLALDTTPDLRTIDDFHARIDQGPMHLLQLRAHPAVPQAVRVSRPDGKLTPAANDVGQIRESDGLEPILRLAAIWQRVGIEPLRQTGQGALYKRDLERIEEDPVLSGAISDALEPLAAMSLLWLSLACRVGLIHADAAGERLEAAGPGFWIDNAVHLPQMIATNWMGLREWQEWENSSDENPEIRLSLTFLRPAVLLWLACLKDDEWVALDDLAQQLRTMNPEWDQPSLRSDPEAAAGAGRRGGGPRARNGSQSARPARGERLLRLLLLGSGYAMGLVRTGEEQGTARAVVQLTPLGRYVLAMGPPPPPRPTFEHFLFVQPNFEIIAYRQGLSPQLVGQLSRFAWWTKIGAALELKLTQESIVLGLEGGQTPEQMLEILTRHSQHPLPTLVPDAIGRWTSRRERIIFYAAATLIEFASLAERDQALAAWQEDDLKTFVPVADRFLLVESPQQIPTDRISTRGSRDYRHPPEKCVSIEPDGVTLTLDPTRSDLLIDAELSRFADELPTARNSSRGMASGTPSRRYSVSAGSLARATALGISPGQIVEWFLHRTGVPPSPAIRLLFKSTASMPTALKARRMLVLFTPTAELADGLLQHPATRDFLGDRLGPMAVAVPEDLLEKLQGVLKELGLLVVPS